METINYAETLIATVIFVVIFLFGYKLKLPTQKYHRKILSFASGVAIAYVFIHLLPSLQTASDVFARETKHLALPFTEYLIYFAAMLSFILFYGLEYLVISTKHHIEAHSITKKFGGPFFILHISAFAIYVWLISYLMVRGLEEQTTPIILYALAMSLHFFATENSLRERHPIMYEKLGKYILVIAAVVGWSVGVFTELPKPIITAFLGFISGGVIMNCMIMELPRKKEGNFSALLLGGIFYAVLLLFMF